MSILVGRRRDGVAILRRDRPERRNALDSATLEVFVAALRGWRARRSSSRPPRLA